MTSIALIVGASILMIAFTIGVAIAFSKAQQNPHSGWAGFLTGAVMLDCALAIVGTAVWILCRWLW